MCPSLKIVGQIKFLLNQLENLRITAGIRVKFTHPSDKEITGANKRLALLPFSFSWDNLSVFMLSFFVFNFFQLRSQ